MSMLGWIVIIMMVVVIGTGALKLMPVYLEYYNIISILENMKNEKALANATKQELASTFSKRLDINSIRLKKEDYSITKVEGRKAYNFRLNYEARRSLMGNLSIVATFDRNFEIGG
jgi:hypothetical protein